MKVSVIIINYHHHHYHLWGHELYGALQLADIHHPALAQLLSQPEVNNLEPVVRVLKKRGESQSPSEIPGVNRSFLEGSFYDDYLL